MLGYLSRAVPLEELDSTGDDRLFVQRVQDIRRFAMEDLGLSASRNYTRYVAIDRDYLAAVVSACADDSFTRHQWWFPVLGAVPYKGFFNPEDARGERARLERKGLDVWLRGVDAFSTLGWFRDPLYSYMKDYSERYLAELIIHELLHATVWLTNQSQFNEELAQFVGTEGARLYMEKSHGIYADGIYADGAGGNASDEAEARSDRQTYQNFLRGLIAELEQVYNSGISREEKLRRKEEIIGSAKTRFEENYEQLFITGNYRFFIDLPVNNAYLDLFRLYHEEDRFFLDLYERSGSDLPRFIDAAKTLDTRKQRGRDPRAELERAMNTRPNLLM